MPSDYKEYAMRNMTGRHKKGILGWKEHMQTQ